LEGSGLVSWIRYWNGIFSHSPVSLLGPSLNHRASQGWLWSFVTIWIQQASPAETALR